jgi:hypothetical protein
MGNLKERGHFQNLGTDGRTILKLCWMSVKWITLAHNGDKSRALLNAVMNVWVP